MTGHSKPRSASLHDAARKWLDGELDDEGFLEQVRPLLVAPARAATLDIDRANRCGFPEVVLAEGKPLEALLDIVATLCRTERSVLVTRLGSEQASFLESRHPQGAYDPVARTWQWHAGGKPPAPVGLVAVVSAGTGDEPVAAEAVETLKWMGIGWEKFTDVGVAGPQRLAGIVPQIRRADAVIVVAGMEGALPSVVGGHVAAPVIAVPTSVGYGASLGGLAALLGMLNSCAANVTVVNIDAGFKGAYVAGLIARRMEARRRS